MDGCDGRRICSCSGRRHTYAVMQLTVLLALQALLAWGCIFSMLGLLAGGLVATLCKRASPPPPRVCCLRAADGDMLDGCRMDAGWTRSGPWNLPLKAAVSLANQSPRIPAAWQRAGDPGRSHRFSSVERSGPIVVPSKRPSCRPHKHMQPGQICCLVIPTLLNQPPSPPPFPPFPPLPLFPLHGPASIGTPVRRANWTDGRTRAAAVIYFFL